MKKVMVFLFLAVAGFGIVACQNSNIGKKIVGTWADIEGSTWTFSADEEFTYSDNTNDGEVLTYKYNIKDTSLTISNVDCIQDSEWSTSDQKYNISFSTNGKTLFLTDGRELGGWSVAGPGWSGNELTKK